ncbi:MAG: helix-turn-helix transcriptional regulator [Desulfuromonadales bacterium]
MKQYPALIQPSLVREVLGISRSTALRYEADPAMCFPKRIVISPGGHLTAWKTDELLAWADSRQRVCKG